MNTSPQNFSARKGKFSLNYSLITKCPSLALDVLSTVLVVRAENDFMTDKITYWALSEHFETVEPGIQPPNYEALVSSKEDGSHTVSWVLKQ